MSAMRSHHYLLALQAGLAAVLIWGDAGFDKAGGLGLDFGGFLVVLAGFGAAWIAGFGQSVRRKAWWTCAGQVVLLPLGFLLFLAAGN